MSHCLVRVKYTGTALPLAAATVVLFDSSVAFPSYSHIQMMGVKRLRVDLKFDQALTLNWYKPTAATTGSTVRPFVSGNWEQIGTEAAIAAPAATSSIVRDFMIAPYPDFKLEAVIGGANETKFIVDMVLDGEIAVAV